MKMSVLALSLSAITSTLYAAEQQPTTEPVTSEADQVSVADVQGNTIAESPASAVVNNSSVVEGSQADQAASALQKKESDATQETNLQEVFTSNERQYSLIKKGEISTFYDLDY